MNPFFVEAKRFLELVLTEGAHTGESEPMARMSFGRAPSASASAATMLVAFAGGVALMLLLVPENRARVVRAFRGLVRRNVTSGDGVPVGLEFEDEEPSGAME